MKIFKTILLWEEIMLHFDYFLSEWGTEIGKKIIAQKNLLKACYLRDLAQTTLSKIAIFSQSVSLCH